MIDNTRNTTPLGKPRKITMFGVPIRAIKMFDGAKYVYDRSITGKSRLVQILTIHALASRRRMNTIQSLAKCGKLVSQELVIHNSPKNWVSLVYGGGSGRRITISEITVTPSRRPRKRTTIYIITCIVTGSSWL